MLDDMVEEIAEENVVQVVTDNASNYVKAGSMLEATRPYLYWTPYAAHCIDLMLEDIGKIPRVRNTLKGAMFCNGYIYNHVGIVNMMRRFTNQRNLHRPAITRFATSFITLSQMHKQKNNLRKMITSPEWNNSKWSKDAAGKRLTSTFLQERFWRNIVFALKLTGPLVKVLRMVDGDKKPAMGYIYESMDRAKETIAASFLHKEEHYKKAFEYIDARWDCQLHRPLHAAGFFLNPELYYKNPENAMCAEVMNGLYATIQRLVPDLSTQDKIGEQLDLYQNAQGLFGNPMAIRQRDKRAPADWWSAYGASAPELHKFAIRLLGHLSLIILLGGHLHQVSSTRKASETSNCRRASRGFSLIDEEIEEDIGVSEDDGEEEVLGIDVDDDDADEF
ncbi:unnamed protein product [Lactuca virosa]|uniref:DUF659 domain-containing protein n=1 Tax=Lactuca virosa TaxID=75947 RepID=A0AAU9N639_9ASTR|nr:unnamed protein product [Lactuca virosa]